VSMIILVGGFRSMTVSLAKFVNVWSGRFV
jgi:hypothetical protein